MKKAMAVLIAVMILVSVFACKPKESVDTSNTVTTLTTDEESKESETTTENTETTKKESVAVYQLSSDFCDMPSRIIFANYARMDYYSKATDEIFILCFDPLCEHGIDCLSNKFYETGLINTQNLDYCKYNQRIYILRGENLFSFAFDGSDLRNEYSYGESGKTFGRAGMIYLSCNVIQYLSVVGKFVVMYHENPDNGLLELAQYDVDSHEMTDLWELLGLNSCGCVGYVPCEDKIVFSITREGAYETYIYDLYEKTSTMISNDPIADLGLYYGDCIYYYSRANDESGRVGSVMKYDMSTGETNKLFDTDKSLEIIAVANDYVYFVPMDKKLVYKSDNGEEHYSYKSQLSRISVDGGDVQLVSAFEEYDIRQVFFLDENRALVACDFMGPPPPAGSESRIYLAEIDEKGVFTSIVLLEPEW